MSDKSIAFQPISALSRLLETGALSAVELTDLYLKRIQQLDGRARSFITVTENLARQSALAADQCRMQGIPHTALSGIPYAVKDLIDVQGVLTTAGSRVFHDNIAEENAFLVDRMTQTGAVMLGKLNLHEFAYGTTGENEVYGTAVNVYDENRLACGSSSGSAAAVAFGLCPASFGTDTGGSVRVPAAMSGLVGLKPTLGRISTRGVTPCCWSLDHVGTVTRTVSDAALLLSSSAGYDSLDPGSANLPSEQYNVALTGTRPLSGLRIGIAERFFFDRADSEILAATESVMRSLARAGADIIKVEMPSMEHCRAVSLTVQMPEALSFHSRYLTERGDLYGKDFRAGLALGQCLLAEHYVRAKRFMTLYRQQTDAVFQDVDVLLTPSTPVIAPARGTISVTLDGVTEAIGNAMTRYTTFFNMTGHPAITVPSGMHSEGLPMGVQLVGRYFDEATLFKVATAIERDDAFRIPLPQPG